MWPPLTTSWGNTQMDLVDDNHSGQHLVEKVCDDKVFETDQFEIFKVGAT